MKRSIITSAVAACAAFVLAGCGAGIDSQTANQVAPVPGFSETYNTTSSAGSVSVRNAYLTYPGTSGYKAGSEATVKIWLFNDTANEVTVVFKSEAGTVTPGESIKIPAAGMAAPQIKLTGLKQAVTGKDNVLILVEFLGIKEFAVPLIIAPPDEAAPRSPMKVTGGSAEGH